jgi:hypothetical protein
MAAYEHAAPPIPTDIFKPSRLALLHDQITLRFRMEVVEKAVASGL